MKDGVESAMVFLDNMKIPLHKNTATNQPHPLSPNNNTNQSPPTPQQQYKSNSIHNHKFNYNNTLLLPIGIDIALRQRDLDPPQSHGVLDVPSVFGHADSVIPCGVGVAIVPWMWLVVKYQFM